MMFWLSIGIALLWSVVAFWRAVRFVSTDMLESWDNGEDYTNGLFAEALRAGLLEGFLWPIVAPFKVLGSVLYRFAFQRANRAFQTTSGPPESKPNLDITGELAKIPAEPIRETRAQARLRREAEAARAEYAEQAGVD